LFIRGVDASRGGIEETRNGSFFRHHQHVGINQHAQHAQSLVVFDKTHSTHVGGEAVDQGNVPDCALARILATKIQLQVFGLWKKLIPFLEWLYVHCPHLLSFAQ
jgi:hypothetical protein